MKRCGCGATYSPAQWQQLPALGLMDDGAGGQLELRNCSCGSTLAVELPREKRHDGQ